MNNTPASPNSISPLAAGANPAPAADWSDLKPIIDEALRQQHFSMVYQPIFSLQNSRLIGFEALVRCQSPRFGFVSPADFIPVAEKTGQIVELGSWILKKSLVDLKRLRQCGLTNICMSLNISPVQIVSGGVFETVMTLANELDIPPECLKIELTETALIENPEIIARTFEVFQKEGVGVWLDDFGTGFASLSLLRKFKIDGLKIDRSFVDGISANNDDFTLCSAVIAMAQRLGLHIVAEGVEDDEQLQILNQLGCESAQGYLLGRPATLEANLSTWGS